MEQAITCKQYVGVISDELWETVQPMLEEASKYSHREFLPADIRWKLVVKEQQLWVVYKGEEVKFVWVTQLVAQTDRNICIVFAAAGDMEYGWDFWPWMSQWMIGNGIDEAEVYCRPSMARLLRRHGLKTLYEVMCIKPVGAEL